MKKTASRLKISWRYNSHAWQGSADSPGAGRPHKSAYQWACYWAWTGARPSCYRMKLNNTLGWVCDKPGAGQGTRHSPDGLPVRRDVRRIVKLLWITLRRHSESWALTCSCNLPFKLCFCLTAGHPTLRSADGSHECLHVTGVAAALWRHRRGNPWLDFREDVISQRYFMIGQPAFIYYSSKRKKEKVNVLRDD